MTIQTISIVKKVHVTILIMATWLAGCVNKQTEPSLSQAKEFSSGEVYVTAQGTDYQLSKTGDLRFVTFGQPKETQPFVYVNENITFQTFEGIGGAVTDASAETFAKLPQQKQKEFLTSCFDQKEGIGYSIVRVNIAGCDFSSASYDYVTESDTLLKSFTISHDEKYRIPMILSIRKDYVKDLLLFASPWSPPAWMKSNNDVLHGGVLLEKYKQVWANHFVKFIDAYSAKGVPVWAVSTQNEPMAVQRWESCVFTAEDESEFIGKYLGPTLEKSPYKGTKIIAWDHNRDLIFQRASTIMNNPEAAKYVWGFGYHWYETWTGGDMQFENVALVHSSFPDKALVFTEGCVDHFNMDSINNWSLGERYGHSMINDFNCGTTAWFDWNVLLDETGGPNHVGNLCFAPVHADTRSGELIYTNSYYYIGHFSKFIKRGAKRIAVSSTRDVLKVTGFKNPDGEVVVILFNKSDKKLDFKLGINGIAADMVSLPHSIMTAVMKQ
jgi:glucosylceramidase